MLYRILLKSQKNEILGAIKRMGLELFSFEWQNEHSEYDSGVEVSKLIYKKTEFFYKFDILGGHHKAFYSPGEESIVGQGDVSYWESQKKLFARWLVWLKREVDAPDLWSEISKYQLSAESELREDVSNDPFTAYQAEQIALGIKKIQVYIEEQGLASGEQNSFVREKLNYLVDATKRLGRKDWVLLAMAVIVTFAVQLALPPDKAQLLWNMLKEAVSGVVQVFLPAKSQ